MGGQILGAMPENLAPCLSLRKIEFLGSGTEWDKEKSTAIHIGVLCLTM